VPTQVIEREVARRGKKKGTHILNRVLRLKTRHPNHAFLHQIIAIY